MGHKTVCFKFRKAFNIAYAQLAQEKIICPQCGGQLVSLDQKFQPPKLNNVTEWEVAEFLFNNGFYFQHVFKEISLSQRVDEFSSSNYVPYPKTMKDARAFVELYKEQARRQK